jgi:hypothetical protein
MESTAFAARRTTRDGETGSIRYIRQTGFYPLYDGENDQVDAVGPVRGVRFQRVIPRYRLSASETNDSGLGPAFYETPVYVGGGRRDSRGGGPETAPPTAGSLRPVLPAWKGRHIDLYA